MTLTDFLNALRILRSIDRGELADAGLELDDGEWRDFRERPYWWICIANEQQAEILWRVVLRRQPRAKEAVNGKS